MLSFIDTYRSHFWLFYLTLILRNKLCVKQNFRIRGGEKHQSWFLGSVRMRKKAHALASSAHRRGHVMSTLQRSFKVPKELLSSLIVVIEWWSWTLDKNAGIYEQDMNTRRGCHGCLPHVIRTSKTRIWQLADGNDARRRELKYRISSSYTRYPVSFAETLCFELQVQQCAVWTNAV